MLGVQDPGLSPSAAGRQLPCTRATAATHALGAAAFLLSLVGGIEGAQPPRSNMQSVQRTPPPPAPVDPTQRPYTIPREPAQVSTVGSSQSSG